ncbi:heptahelical transmembrane protein ADIPOR3-like [Asparagus officinalis]|uniref:heptahelical transmembrane protein ADIPOR3-like n=1 Tax=Asparagus officinalis TaxID=4686 RepID=UPI00098DE76D|nr:heptahelical transmembrane protein ADIPOR3-like [Asparagus officinalis]
MSCTVTLEKTISFSRSSNQFLVTLIKEEDKKENTRSINELNKRKLVNYDSLPDFLKHNEFVVNYYRSEWPLKQAILSIFSIHNETLNIWTHLIGFFIFLSLAATLMLSVNGVSIPLKLHQELLVLPSFEPKTIKPIARWPFYTYLTGAMFCLLISSLCHLLSCHSKHTCYVMLRLDYTGISALIVTSFYPLLYYTFACDPFFRNLYMSFITVFGLASVIVSLVPVFEKPEFLMVRTGLFACMGFSGLVPIIHKMVAFGDRPEAVITTVYELMMLSFYGVGVIVYALRIPERWLPGKFDLIGHSHQLWHVLVIAGAYTHYLAGLVYLSWRDVEGC